MEPRNEQYGSRSGPPDGGDFRGFGRSGRDPFDERTDEWDAPPTAQLMVAAAKARTGLLLIIAFALEFLVIVGVGNQWVSDKIARLNPSTFMGLGLRNVALVYAWRFTPRAHDTGHVWIGSLVLIVTTFVLSLLLIAAVIRGPVGFGRAFLGTWMAVAVATMIGGYVRGLVVDYSFIRGQGGRAEMALFGTTSPGSIYFLAGLGLGFIVALVVGIVAPLTRRSPPLSGRAGAPAAAEPGTGPWQDQFYGPPPRPEPFDGRDEGGDRTTQLPSLHNDDEPGETTRLPSFDASPTAWSQAPARDREQDDRQTTALPVQSSREPAEAESGSDERPADREPAEAEPATSADAATANRPAEAESAESAPPRQQAAEREPEPAPEPESAQPREPAAEPEPAPEQETQALPVQEVPGHERPAEQPEPAAAPATLPPSGPVTAQFPRPPDDEDFDPEIR